MKKKTLAEIYLTTILQKKWLWRFMEQVPIGNYFADFFFPDFGLIVELDGGVHLARTEYDSKRDGFISTRSARFGDTYFEVLRFDNDILFHYPYEVLTSIENALKARIPKIKAYGHRWVRVKIHDELGQIRYQMRLRRGQDLRNMEKAIKEWKRKEHFLNPYHTEENPKDKCEICCDKGLQKSYRELQSIN